MTHPIGAWRVEQRHNYEPSPLAPQFGWRITTKAHENASPKTLALIDTEANALRMAAAEEMYEALENLTFYIINDGVPVSQLKQAVNQAQQALAKARKETQ